MKTKIWVSAEDVGEWLNFKVTRGHQRCTIAYNGEERRWARSPEFDRFLKRHGNEFERITRIAAKEYRFRKERTQ